MTKWLFYIVGYCSKSGKSEQKIMQWQEGIANWGHVSKMAVFRPKRKKNKKKTSHYVTTISGSLSLFDRLSYDQNIKD